MEKELLNQEKSFIAMCKFLLLLFIALILSFIGISGVFAEQVNVGYITNKTDFLLDVGGGAPVSLPANTTNSYGLINQVWVNINNIDINKDYVYQVEISTPYATFSNVNTMNIVANGNQICTAIGFTDASIGFPKIYFQCLSSFTSGTLMINLYDNSGSLNGIVSNSNTFRWNYTYLRYFDDDDDIDLIVSNATQNTNNIINNQNQNTQNIINNQNQNTQEQIESQKVCKVIDKSYIEKNNYILNSSGVEVSGTNFGITSYIPINNTSTLFPIEIINNGASLCFYKDDKSVISCVLNNTLILNNNLTIPNNAVYFRATINYSYNKPIFKLCTNGNQALDDSINNLNDSLNNDDSSGATSEASDFFSSFSTNTFGLTSIITAPLNLIQSLTSSTCTELHLPLPYLNNKYLDLPCMSTIYSTYFGTFFTLYQTITYGIIAYWVIVRIFNQVKDFKNPEHDEIEVVDL